VNILVLHDGGKTDGKVLLDLIENKAGGVSGVFCCSFPEDEQSFTRSLREATHVVMFAPPETEVLPWMIFTAGFCKGSGKILILYGNGEVYTDHFLLGGLPFVSSEPELAAFLDRRLESWLTAERRQNAREAILGLNISFSASAFALCVAEGNEEGASLFLAADFSPDTKNQDGVPLLCLAVRGGHEKLVRLLLDAGADVNLRTEDRGATALVDAALGRLSGIMELLIKAGADVNARTSDGQSALIIAVGLDDTASAELLLKAGADPDADDSLGASARKYAALFKKAPMLALFREYASPLP
jgi:hypothetical protein